MSKRKNVGVVDRVLRFLLGLVLLYLGLFVWAGIQGSILGLAVAASSALPFYMAISRSCFVFRWFHINSLTKTECEILGEPYPEKATNNE